VDAVFGAALSAATFHPLCNLVFRCGCAWYFAGGDAHCNVHVPGPPDCPPCASLAAGAAFAAALFGGWLAAARAARLAVASRARV
jgi:hypothetical protein